MSTIQKVTACVVHRQTIPLMVLRIPLRKDASNHDHTDDADDILTGDSTDIINLYCTVRCYARLDYIILYDITLCCALHYEY